MGRTFTPMQLVPVVKPDPPLGFPDVREVGSAFREDLATFAVDNRLAKAALSLAVVEQRLFFLTTATIRNGDTGPVLVRIPLATYARVFHAGKEHHDLARDLAKAVEGLNKRRVVVAHAHGAIEVPLVAGAWYVTGQTSGDGKPHVLIQLHAALTPYLFNLSGGFTKFPISTLAGVGSKYTVPLLLLLRARTGGQNAFTTKLPLEALRQALGIRGYKQRADLAKRVLAPARKELRLRNVVLRYRFRGHGPDTMVEFHGYFGDLNAFDPAEGPKARATRLAASLNFTGSLEPWADHHGWETVEAEVDRIHAYIRSRPADRRIVNPGAYLRSALDKLNERAPAEAGAQPAASPESVLPPKADPLSPAPVIGDVSGRAGALLKRLNDERHAYLATRFGALDHAAQKHFKDAARQALHLGMVKRFQESMDPTRLINARALDLFEESDAVDYPVELRSVEAYVAARRPLDHLDPALMSAVIREARQRFDDS